MIGWLAGEVAASYIHWEARPREGKVGGRGQGDTDGGRLLIAAQSDAETKNAALAMGVLGGILGVAFGVAGGLCRLSTPRAALGGTTGVMFGTAIGVAVAFVIVPRFYHQAGRPPNPWLPLLCHTAMYSSIGAVGGLAFGLGFKGWGDAARGFLAGGMGAALGSIFYNVFHTFAFPLEWDFFPMPGKTTSRLLAHLCVALPTVICIVAALIGREQRVLDETDIPLDHT
jgi:hypothetical protein